ncbi:MAG TPA: response regulator [Gammaproteobacteria bacterium]|nr:response regulator [Gammaproteobacteria bacterium]
MSGSRSGHADTMPPMNGRFLHGNHVLYLARLSGIVSLLLGVIVLLGWYLHQPALIQVSPAFVPMQYNTALGFALSGLALLGLSGDWSRTAALSSFVVLLVGLLTLFQYLSGVDLHIDQLFMEHYIDLQTSNPGRMAPNTALCFSLTGLTVLLGTGFARYARIGAWMAILGALIISLGVVALAGYLIGVEGAYGWGHMTRMAIHTAAGFIVLGTGFIALAWERDRNRAGHERLPHWLAGVIVITGFTITFALWQALSAQESRMVAGMGAGARNLSDEGLLVFGILLTLVLAFKARAMAGSGHGRRRSRRDFAPAVVVALGVLLAASLFSLLHTGFQASVQQRFEAAARNHADALAHGIEVYLETLYHIRSAYEASPFVTREEFHALVKRSLARNTGIRALEWVPKVPAAERKALEATARQQLSADFVLRDRPVANGKVIPAPVRDVYYPIYFVEPRAMFRSVLGYDLAARPEYLETLEKAARNNSPAVSPRLQLDQSEPGMYSVFVALPVYRQGMPLQTAAQREAAVAGFAVMVTEIGPMTEAILDKSTRPAGLTLVFRDANNPESRAFMYRHVSRNLEPGTENTGAATSDDVLSYTTLLPFADHKWELTAYAASKRFYPRWNTGSIWLPLGILLLALGLAYFLHRLRRADAAVNYNRMLMHAVLDNSPAVIYLKDLAGRYLMVNRVWCEVSGVDEARAMGATDFDLFPAPVAESFAGNDRRVAEAGRAIRSEEHLPQEDGSVHTYMSYKFPVEDEEGEVFAVGGVSSDITEIKQRERQYRILVDTIPGTVYRCRMDANWTMLFVSSEVEVLTGYPPVDFLGDAGRSFAGLIHPEDSAARAASVAAAVAAHTPYMVEYRIFHADGGVRYVYERGQAEYGEDGSAEMLDGTILDVTELKSLQADLETARDLADAANQAKSAFLANMSHELRTPMNAILGYSEMLMEEAEDAGQEDFIPDLKKINQAGTHLLALINDVLDLSKIESGKMEAFAEDIDIDAFIDEVSGTAHPLMEKNGNTLSVERGPRLGTARQDLTRLRQTLFNLLSNAAKFTHNGTVTLHVNRTRQEDGAWLTFAVSDTGIGIAEDKLDTVFEEFTQADGSTTRDYGGTGLGLAISRRFCKLMGGDLSVYSELGHGSTFTVRVPVSLPGKEAGKTAPVSATDRVALDEARETGSGARILVIDDDPEACEIIRRYLTRDGYAVVTAANGEQGLRLARELRPVAITLDVMMPGMDGWSVLRVLKADPVLRTIPVIMLTMINDRTRGYSLGAVDYLTKPVDRELLHKVLSRYSTAGEAGMALLVEDDTDTRAVIARSLEKAGWQVSEAGNGEEALVRMASQTPGLILLDLMMPVMDGFDFLLAMRAKPEWRHIPVVVVTAKDLSEEERGQLAGLVEHVVEKRAWTREQLLEHVREAVAACQLDHAGIHRTGTEHEQDTAG